MSRIRKEVSTVQFQVDARAANASMQALQAKSEDLAKEILHVKEEIAGLGNVAPDHQGLLKFQKELRQLNSDLKDVQNTMRDYMRGVKAADQLWQAHARGDIEGLSIKAIKSGQNGLRKRMENLSPGDPEAAKTMRAYEAVIQEADQVMKTFKTDALNTIQILRDGGSVAEGAMRKTLGALKELMDAEKEGTAEYINLNRQYDFMDAKLKELIDTRRREKGELVDANDARREALKLTKEGAEAAQKEREMADMLVNTYEKEISDLEQLRRLQQEQIEGTETLIERNHRLQDEEQRKMDKKEKELQMAEKLDRENAENYRKEAEAAKEQADLMEANARKEETTAQKHHQHAEQVKGDIDAINAKLAELNNQPQQPVNPTMEAVKAGAEQAAVDVDALKKKLEELANEKKDLEIKMSNFRFDEKMAAAFDKDLDKRTQKVLEQIDALPNTDVGGRVIIQGNKRFSKKNMLIAKNQDFNYEYEKAKFDALEFKSNIESREGLIDDRDELRKKEALDYWKKQYEAMRDAVSEGKRLLEVPENQANPATVKELERRVALMEQLKAVYKETYDMLRQYGNKISEQWGDDIYEEKVSLNTKEKEATQKRINEIDQQSLDIQNQITAATEKSTAANEKETKSIKEKEEELARLKSELEEVRRFREAAETQKEEAEKAFGGKSVWDNERYVKAYEEDVAAKEKAIKKLDDKWDTYWNKQEENAKKFAEVLGKSLEDVNYEDFQKNVTGPNAELAKAWYRKNVRDDEGLEIWTEDNNKGRDIKYFRDNKKLGLSTPEEEEELKLLEGLKRKWDEYWRARDKAENDKPKSDAVFEELDKYKTQAIQADVRIEKATNRATELKQQIADKEKEIAEAQQQSTAATEEHTEAIKKEDEELNKLISKLDRFKKELAEYEKDANENLKELMQLGLSEEDLADDAKVREAVEKKVLEIMEAQSKVGQEIVEQRRKLTGEISMSQLGGTKADQEFYAKNKGRYELEDYATPDDMVERIAHLERLSKLKNGKRFNPDEDWEDDELDEDAPVMTDQEKKAIQDELRFLKQHIREELLKTIKEVGDIDKAVEQYTGGDGVSEEAKFGEQLNDKISDLKDKIEEKIVTTLDKYGEMLTEDRDEDAQLTKEQLTEHVGHHVGAIKENLGFNRGWIEETQGDIETTKGQIDAKQQLIQTMKQGTQAQKEETQATEESVDVDKQKEELLEQKRQKEDEYKQALDEETKAQQSADKARQDANTKLSESMQLEQKAANMEDTVAHAAENHASAMEHAGEKARKLQVEEQELEKTLEGQEQILHNIDGAIADNEVKRGEAESQKAQAQELTIKRMEEMLSLLRQENAEVIPANTDKWRENEAEIEKLDQTIRELKGEWMSYGDAAKLAAEATAAGEGRGNFIATAQQMQQAQQAVQREYDKTIKSLQQLERAETKDTKAISEEKAKLQQLEKQLKDLKFEQDNFNMSHDKMQQLLKEPTKATDLEEFRAAIKRADGELKRMKDSLGDGSEGYKKFAEQVKNSKNVLKEMESQAKATTGSWEKAWSRLKTYVGMYMGFNMAWQRITGTADDLMELSDKMGEVRKTTDLSAEAVGRLTSNLKKMDVRTGLVQLEELAASAGQLGLKREEDILGFTEAANKLMIALPEMGKEAATQMMRVAMATGEVKKIEEQMQQGIIDGSSATAVAMEKIASTIDRLRASSASTAPEITDFVKRVGAVGAQSGITIDQIAAMGSTISSLGMRIEMSATALSRMIPAIKNNAFAIGKIIGKTETEIKEKFENGMGMQVILDVFKAIRGNVSVTADDIINNTENMEKAAEKVEEMFGGSMKEVMAELNQQGARAGIVFAGLSQNVDQLEKQLDIANKAYTENIAIQKEFDKMNDTTAAKWERFKNVIEEWILGDWQQRWLGGLIDGLRELADWLSEDGPLAIAFKSWVAYLAALKMGFGSFFTGVNQGFATLWTAIRAGVNVFATTAGNAIYALTGMTNAMRGLRAATIGARREWIKMDKAMKSNLIGAIIAALGMLAYKLWDIHKAAKEAAADTARFNQQVADEQHALDKLMDPLEKSNMAQEERSKLIKDINAQYGKYLGYMLSEYSSAMQVADAHALIAKRIKQETYERRLAEQERKVYEQHDEAINEAYGGVEKAVRGGAKSGTDVNAVADMLKGYIDQNLDRTETLESFRAFRTELNNVLERLVTDGKLTRGSISSVTPRLLDYMDAAKQRANDLKAATSGIRSDLRTINSSIQNDLTRNLNNLVGNIANFAKQQTQTPAPAPAPMPAPASGQSTALTPFWQQGGGSGKGFGLFDMNGRLQQEQTVQRAPIGWKPQLNEKDVEEVRQFVENQKNLRSMLQNDAAGMEQSTREIYESWQVSDEEMTRLEKIVIKADKKTTGGDNTKPYGSYDVMDGYEKWDADALVKRKKQMLDYVRAMANGADVQAILAQDKKFMDEATRKGIKDVRDAIEWYNTERLKIQEELADRHLTNEGNWANPSKAKGRRKRMPIAESAIAELERYYQWRKEEIEEKRAEEGMSEAEYNRRLETLEMEHLQKRSDLRKSYITKDKQFVTQFRDWWKSVRELDAVEWELIEIEVKAATERERKYIGMNAQKDLTSMQAIVVKQLNAIEEIIAKERPFNGITKNLEENLTKMGILFADFDSKRAELVAKGASKEELDKVDAAADAERNKRLLWLLQQAEDGYTLTIDEMMRRMADSGFQAWVDELSSNENGDEMKRALLAQLHTSYDAVQEAIKKEASIIKKQVEVMWSDVAKGQTMSIKDQYEEAISALGLQQDSVSRANNLIGAGAASERVADKLAIKQLQLRITMQEHYYNLMRKQGAERIAFLRDEAKLEKEKAARLKKQIEQETDEEKKRELAMKMEKAERNAMQASLDAEHADTSLNLAKTKEKAELLKLQTELTAKAEESQNRLYTQLKEWGDLLSSSVQGLMEATHAGDAEYYNERAKLDLTGKGGPGAGTYIVIDNEGTSDAKAHYEYLDERAALERQHEIERQNAQADAWKKVMDDINMKMSDMITDQLNAMLQNASVDANTQAVMANTKAIYEQMKAEESIDYTDTTKLKHDKNGMALDKYGQVITPLAPKTGEKDADASKISGLWDSDNLVKAQQWWQGYKEAGVEAMSETADAAQQAKEAEINASKESADAQISDIERVKQAKIDASNQTTQVVINNSEKEKDTTKNNDNEETKSTASKFASMASACNMYGIAYQTMSNDNFDTFQKFQMFALQAAGQTAIAMLTTDAFKAEGDAAVKLPGIFGKAVEGLGPIAGPIAFAAMTALLGGLMATAVSKVSKSKSQIAQVTGASMSAGRLSTGMLTYAEGNVNEFSDPAQLTPGRSYNVDAADGRTYRAKYTGRNPSTHLTNGPEFHLAGEKGREMIIDAGTTRQITMNETEIWHAIKTLSSGGRMASHRSMRRGVRAFADGNVDEFDSVVKDDLTTDLGFDPVAMKDSLDKNNELLERALADGIKGVFNVYGPDGLVATYDKGKNTLNRHKERH